MAIFQKGNNQTSIPAEIQEYYETGKRDRTGVAWLLAIGTLLLTIILAAGIFFAGRWTYRKIAGSDNKAPVVTQNENKQQETTDPEVTTPSETEKHNSEAERKAEEQSKAEAEAQKLKEEQKAAEQLKQEAERKTAEELAAKKKAEQQNIASSSPVAGSSVATGKDIPETGPGDTLAIFVAVSFLGYVVHRFRFAKR